MENVSRLSTGLLMLQDRVPYVLGPRPRFVLDRVEAGGRREVSYRVRSDLRGRYPLGPLQLRLTDPFGMCELTRSFSTYDTLTVIPRVEALPPVRLTGEAKGYGDGRQRSLALAGEDDIIPRGYRYGDDLRRVHWRLTARYGELMVRREEQPQRSRCTVLLDTRGVAFRGAGPDSAFEWAVAGAASTLVHMLERGFSVRLLTDTGSSVPGEGAEGFTGASQESADAAGMMMDTLAVIDHSDGTGLSPAYDVLRGGNEGLLIAFLGDLDEEQASVLGKMRQRSGGAVAFLLDSESWVREPSDVSGPLDRSEDRLRMLREAGWTAVTVPRGCPWPSCGGRRTACARTWRRRGRPRGWHMSGRARLAVCATAATLMASCALLPLVDPATWLFQAAFLLAVQSGVGALTRRVPLARPLTVAAQALVTLMMLTLVFARQQAVALIVPGPEAFQHLGTLLQAGTDDVGRYSIPAPLSDGIRLMLVGGVLVIGLAVDALAVTYRSAAPAGLPLLALYSVAAGLAGGGAAWLWFLLAAAGYLMLLLAEGRDRLSQWGRVFGGAPRAPGPDLATGAVAPVRTGRRIGAVALGIALVVPLALPSLDGGLLDGTGRGVGNGPGGGGTISAVNPLVSLRDSLNVDEDRTVMTYRTNTNETQDLYLRIVSLDDFDGTAWKPPSGTSRRCRRRSRRRSASAVTSGGPRSRPASRRPSGTGRTGCRCPTRPARSTSAAPGGTSPWGAPSSATTARTPAGCSTR